mmetsp:Transcript_78832/g.96394  ORF Transcript_78832/g.96394 Transcript_78832/m.96394 type:complete len:216 (+) Transcript_78832:1-648(+)
MISVLSTYLDKIYNIIVLAIDEDGPKKFWNKNGFTIINDSNIEYKHIFDMNLMINKGFIVDSEDELIMMNYNGNMNKNIILNSKTLNNFIKPTYVNMDKRYAHKHEIKEIEKERQENPELYKEYQNQLKKIENGEIQDLIDDDDDDIYKLSDESINDDDTDDEYTSNDDELSPSNNNDNNTTNDDIKPETSNNDTTNNDGSNNDTINDDINDETQ